jgi:Membrane carboxypeptidase/penicillin-binding protein
MVKRRKTKRLKKRKAQKGITFYLILAFLSSALLLGGTSLLLFFYYSRQLPDFASLKEPNLNAYSIVYSEEDEIVGKFLLENRIPIAYEKIPKTLIQAFLAAEDAEFFQHRGVDYKGIARAMLKNLIAGKDCPGGKYHHSAGDQDLLPHSQEKFPQKIERGRLCLCARTELHKRGDSLSLPESYLSWKRCLWH